MKPPVDYDRIDPLAFGGTKPQTLSYEDSAVVVLPVPLDRTTSYVPGTRNGPREILTASSHLELYDEEVQRRRPSHRHLHTARDGISVRLAGRCHGRDPACGGRHRQRPENFRSSSVASIRLQHPSWPLSPRVIRGCRCCRLTRTPTSATPTWDRVTTMHVRCAASSNTPAARRWAFEVCRLKRPASCTRCRPRSIYDISMRADEDWIDRIVDSLGETVYITIDCDGMDPAIMPAVGTPEPGGLVVVRNARAVAARD